MFDSRLSLLAGVLFSGTVAAAVQFDPETGVGFVPGAEVQTPFAWTEAQFQQRSPGVSFRYRSTGRYNGICTWTGSQGASAEEQRSQTFAWEAPLTSGLHHHGQQRARVDGFQLMGFARASGAADKVPAVGSPCSGGGGQTGSWTVLTPLVQSRTLLVRFGGVDVVLPF